MGINVNPGTTVYMETEVDAPGQWAFHCHLSYHAAAGMFRKVIIEGGPDSTQAKTDVIAEDGGEALESPSDVDANGPWGNPWPFFRERITKKKPRSTKKKKKKKNP